MERIACKYEGGLSAEVTWARPRSQGAARKGRELNHYRAQQRDKRNRLRLRSLLQKLHMPDKYEQVMLLSSWKKRFGAVAVIMIGTGGRDKSRQRAARLVAITRRQVRLLKRKEIDNDIVEEE